MNFLEKNSFIQKMISQGDAVGNLIAAFKRLLVFFYPWHTRQGRRLDLNHNVYSLQLRTSLERCRSLTFVASTRTTTTTTDFINTCMLLVEVHLQCYSMELRVEWVEGIRY
ncbi:unnamed protein product [Albugo candida]|uniref:Uncharacterized protein n=1 Tax=Albugo candida TaxID=65357 RepID=A0A024FZJ6_9STRA|nr:unnamed protein product [Albugo candida]|eukprot:CCI39832.1 unnamed protein product [Albugo candida]